MAIEGIESSSCNGCGACVRSCPADVLRMDGAKALVQYPQDCVLCCWCLAECPQGAIIFSAVRTSPLFTSWG